MNTEIFYSGQEDAVCRANVITEIFIQAREMLYVEQM